MTRVLLVFGAGGLGCVTRYLVNLAVGQRAFPYATLAVNVIGSFLIALVVELSLRTTGISANAKLALTTGFLGGLTTYSSFNNESLTLFFDGSPLRGAANILVTFVGCAAAGLAGIGVARSLA